MLRYVKFGRVEALVAAAGCCSGGQGREFDLREEDTPQCFANVGGGTVEDYLSVQWNV